ncbi:MAG: response regulator transcription factor [Hyphomicrobiaceae bacterium]
MKVLLIEDDEEMSSHVAKALRKEGHEVDMAYDGQVGLELGADESYNVLVIDRMLPHTDGLTIVKTLRSSGVQTPVLFLTALGGIDDRVAGLEAGGDDYLIKPFAFSELLARLNALTRRPLVSAVDPVLKVHDLEMDRIARTVRRGGERIEIQPREFALLEYLMKHAGRIVTKTMLLENVWNFHFDPKTNIVETHISRLRSKVDRGRPVELIQTIRGSGYMIGAPE